MCNNSNNNNVIIISVILSLVGFEVSKIVRENVIKIIKKYLFHGKVIYDNERRK